MSGGFQVAEAETLVRSKAERQQAAVDASRRKRRDAEATGSAPRTVAADVSNSTSQAEDKRRRNAEGHGGHEAAEVDAIIREEMDKIHRGNRKDQEKGTKNYVEHYGRYIAKQRNRGCRR